VNLCPMEPLRHRRAFAADVTWAGGKTFENMAHEPQTFYSPREKAQYMRTHGIEEFVRHQPVPGTDKSPHTTRWSGITRETLDGARQMLERIGGQGGHDAEPQTWIERFVPATEVGVTRVRGER